MRVRAIATGFDNLTIREPDDEFHMPDGSFGTWFVPADEKRAPVEQEPAHQKQGKGKHHDSLA